MANDDLALRLLAIATLKTRNCVGVLQIVRDYVVGVDY